ncbi:GATA transcription factor 19-like [Dioscorea cayenensis subsp. rotundata]|uniref:GATA transcription factor 19-like n=1 Tax=Dioscorea cayennensis subsp. rotundata TaxID=55577 RepID=A0AB40ARI7_DIOCR|nr:GATA transcription factor 19-like [Dioscorea cayenensis subsp. rotundata]XP_039116852.1 GATA transcription factor 19-like [Dioscorea cayenensis subsp. rotundata]
MYGAVHNPLPIPASPDTDAGEDNLIARACALPLPMQMQGHQGGSSQLTLSFQGEAFVFDSVSPERVQAVLLLLGGHEVPSDAADLRAPLLPNSRASSDVSRSSSNARRQKAMIRYREKRKNMSFEKKIIYEVRKDVASRMKRHKGQFASSKSKLDEVASCLSGWDPSQYNGEDAHQTHCQHCGISKDSTPMMRRGPSGPKSLCNACGLTWANKGTLRNLRQSSFCGPVSQSVSTNEQSDASDSDVASKSQNLLVPAAPNGQMPEVIGGIGLSCPGSLEEDNAGQLQWITGLGKGAFCS